MNADDIKNKNDFEKWMKQDFVDNVDRADEYSMGIHDATTTILHVFQTLRKSGVL